MSERFNLTALMTTINRRMRGVSDPRIMHPVREWFVGLGLTAILVGAGAWYSFSLHARFTAAVTEPDTVPATVTPYRAAIVDNALQLIDKQRSAYVELGGILSAPALPETIFGPDTSILEPEQTATTAPTSTVSIAENEITSTTTSVDEVFETATVTTPLREVSPTAAPDLAI